VVGKNVVVDSRWADGHIDRFAGLMAEAVANKPDIIVTYTTPAAIAGKAATSTIPIVNGVMGDPIATGLVSSLARPGGNLTGLSMGHAEGIESKWLELLQEIVPQLSTLIVVANPEHAMSREYLKRLQAAANARGVKVRLFAVQVPEDLNRDFEQTRRNAQAILVLADPNLIAHQQRVIALASKYRLPDMEVERDFVDVGGLMSYAPDYVTMFRRTADYVDRILRGAKPGDLPIEQPAKFELVVNLKTAKARQCPGLS
jgi:putative ABC transport system substrate-binding protein